MKDPRFISRDELLAAGALDCPDWMRKSLSGRKRPNSAQRELFTDAADEKAEKQPPAIDEPDGEDPADEGA